MVLTDTGQMVYRYADEIFTLGRELTDVLKGMPSRDSLRLTVGVPDVLPKLVVYQLLKPALELEEKVRLVCYEGKLNELLSGSGLASTGHRAGRLTADARIAHSGIQSLAG